MPLDTDILDNIVRITDLNLGVLIGNSPPIILLIVTYDRRTSNDREIRQEYNLASRDLSMIRSVVKGLSTFDRPDSKFATAMQYLDSLAKMYGEKLPYVLSMPEHILTDIRRVA